MGVCLAFQAFTVTAGKPFHHHIPMAGLHPFCESLIFSDKRNLFAGVTEHLGGIGGAEVVAPD